jgi:hypothetical protein
LVLSLPCSLLLVDLHTTHWIFRHDCSSPFLMLDAIEPLRSYGGAKAKTHPAPGC